MAEEVGSWHGEGSLVPGSGLPSDGPEGPGLVP